MKEIKFKFWDKEKKRMSNPSTLGNSFISWNDGDVMMPLEFGMAKDRLIARQFTGLTDKQGLEIYEGDICLDELGVTFKVIFQDGCYYAEYLDKDILIFGFDVKFNIIAIGNIYENPELLSDQK